MADQDVVLRSLREFAASMGDTYDIHEVSHRLGIGVRDGIDTLGAGVSVTDQAGDLQFISATGDIVAAIEDAQSQNQSGPCVAAFKSQRQVIVEDVSNTNEWPEYSATAIGLGVKAIVGQPLSHRNTRIGALNVYDSGRRSWSDEDLDVIEVFADMATAYILRSAELVASQEIGRQLEHALQSRIVIEQAKGVISGESGTSVDDAFSLIRGHARETNTRLADLCHAIVEDGFRIAPSS